VAAEFFDAERFRGGLQLRFHNLNPALNRNRRRAELLNLA
jgi:hypothetical protein